MNCFVYMVFIFFSVVHQLTDNVASTSASKVEANQAPDSTTTIDTPSKLTRNKVSIMQGGPFKRDTKVL